jgi:hypothetical protein
MAVAVAATIVAIDSHYGASAVVPVPFPLVPLLKETPIEGCSEEPLAVTTEAPAHLLRRHAPHPCGPRVTPFDDRLCSPAGDMQAPTAR